MQPSSDNKRGTLVRRHFVLVKENHSRRSNPAQLEFFSANAKCLPSSQQKVRFHIPGIKNIFVHAASAFTTKHKCAVCLFRVLLAASITNRWE